jgi:hypothetical protein
LSQKSKDGTQQMGADRGHIHRCAVCRRSWQTPHHLPRTISAPAFVGAHNAPRSFPPKHSAIRMCATPPTLPPSETLCRRGARNAPGSLPPKQSPANVRATPLTSLRPEHSATNVGARAGGEVGALSWRSSSGTSTSTGTGGGTDGRRPENRKIKNECGRKSRRTQSDDPIENNLARF